MVNIAALMQALPVSTLEPDWVASLGGFINVPKEREWQERIRLLEPPAGQHVPYIEPVAALEKLLQHQGLEKEAAQLSTREAASRMKTDIGDDRWVCFFDDFDPDSPECLPVPDFVAWLRQKIPVLSGIADFFEQAVEVATSTPMFRGPDNWNEPWTLANLPSLPPPKAMIQFVPGPPWAERDDGNWVDDPDCYYPLYKPFHRWRESMRPIAQALEAALGEPVYYFGNLASDIDDDEVHRFLVLHWFCTYKPESAFVRYLVKVSGARDVEELKAALIDPASYTHPFQMNHLDSIEARSIHLDYRPPEVHQIPDVPG